MITRLHKLWRDRRGNALVIVAAGLPVLLGAAGLGVDTFALSVLKRQLQRAADSAALAGAYAKAQGADINDAVDSDNDLNSIAGRLSVAPVVESAPTVGAFAGQANAVRVSLTADGYSPFITFFLDRTIGLRTEAVARYDDSGEYCVVALYGGSDTGIDITGDADLSLGCGMKTNSGGPSAFEVTGSAQIDADPLAAVGAIPASDNIPSGTTIQQYQTPQKDPFADIPDPPDCSTALDWSDNPHDTNNRTAADDGSDDGEICVEDFDIKGTLNLAPGIYYITGDVHINSGASITGDGVTLVLTGPDGQAGDLDINASANVDITAPSTGDYAGVAIYRDRRSDPDDSKSTSLNGGANLAIQGAIYLPTTNVTINGNFGLEAQCIQFVGYKIKINGGGSLANTCPPGSGVDPIKGTIVRLVG